MRGLLFFAGDVAIQQRRESKRRQADTLGAVCCTGERNDEEDDVGNGDDRDMLRDDGNSAGMAPMQMGHDGKPLPSPRKMADVDLSGAKIMISYGAPSVRGRKIVGGLVPYNTWWRTGANEATSFETTADVMVGTLKVPAGKYTLVTLPSAGTWQLVVCKHTGQWGTERFEKDDLGKTNMMKAALPSAQEVMSIDFEKTMGGKTQLHVKWADTDVWVPVTHTK